MDGSERRPIPFPEGPLPRPWPRFLAWGAVAYTLFLLYATHHPKPENLVGANPPSDKLLHFLAYGALAGIVSAAVAARGGWSIRTAASALVLLAVFAAADEATQPIFGRAADVFDWAYDEVGLLAGLATITAAVAAVRALSPHGVGR